METAATTGRQRRTFFGMFSRRERWGLSGRGWLTLILTSAVLLYIWMRTVHPFLAITNRTDAKILVMEGWVHEYAIQDTIEEFKRGHYDMVYSTGGPIPGSDGDVNDFNTYASVGGFLLIKNGLAKESVQMVPSHVRNRDRTYSSAVALRDWFQEHHITVTKLNLLTQDVHARRSHLLFQEAFGPGVEIGIIAVPNPEYDPHRWWHYSEGVREILGESIAYVYARFFFHPGPTEK